MRRKLELQQRMDHVETKLNAVEACMGDSFAEEHI
jgi:hypothetical protein